jgi:large subunit ribosomal protein L25
MSITLKAESRNNLGTASAKKIKRLGLVPAVIYSKNGNNHISLNFKELEIQYKKGNLLSTLIELDISGKKVKAIAHKIELDPVSDMPIHLDFIMHENNKSLRSKPKIIFTNQEKSPGIKKGGFLHVVSRRVEIICENEKNLPNTLDIDIGSLHLGNKIRANDINLPAGVKLFKKNNFLIASIIGRGKSEDEKATAVPVAGAPTAGTTPPAQAKSDEKKPEAKK